MPKRVCARTSKEKSAPASAETPADSHVEPLQLCIDGAARHLRRCVEAWEKGDGVKAFRLMEMALGLLDGAKSQKKAKQEEK